MCTGQPLSQAYPGKSVVRRADHLNMTIAVDWDVTPQIKQKTKSFPEASCLEKNIWGDSVRQR